MPQITALMTTYNSASHLRATMDSILAQTFTDFEFLILDDGSTDNTVDIIKSYSDERIRLTVHKDNQGVGVRLQEALQLVETPFIAKVDSDDISDSERFFKQLSYLQQHSELALVKSYVDYFADDIEVELSERFAFIKNTKQKEINEIDSIEVISHELRRWLCVPHTTYFARTEAVKRAGYPNSRTYEDYGLFYRMIRNGDKFGCVCEPLVKMRISNVSTTATVRAEALDEGLKTIVEFKYPDIAPLLIKDKLYIYGCGQLAQSLARVMQAKGILIQGYVDRKAENVKLHTVLPILSLEEFLNSKTSKAIIVAAQPVRAELCQNLVESGLLEWNDFMVIA